MIEEKPTVGRAIYFRAIFPTAIAVSLFAALALIGLGIIISNHGADWLGLGLLAFGGIGGIIFFFVLACEFSSQGSLLTEHIAREQAMTAQIKPPSAEQKKTALEIHDRLVDEQGNWRGTLIKRYDNPPTKDFIEAVSVMAFGDGTRGRRVPERRIGEIAKSRGWTAWNAWLDIMEKEGILTPEHDAPNAPRKWADGISVMNAEAIFGYADYSPARSGVSNLQ